jgi:hypothetical protein
MAAASGIHAVNGSYQITGIINRSELPAQTRDMVRDGALINVMLVAARRFHDQAGSPSLASKKLGDRESDRFALPGTYMLPRVNPQVTCTQLGRS